MNGTLSPAIRDVLFAPPAPARGARRLLTSAAGAALDLLFPPHCVSCNVPLPPEMNKSLCLACAGKIRWIEADRCRRCGDGVGLGAGVVADCPTCRTHPPVFVRAGCAVARYAEGPLRDIILGLKFGRKLHLARMIGELLAARVRATALPVENCVVVPVPQARSSIARRGFNHTEEIAYWLCRRLGLRCQPGLLQKIRVTPPQAVLTHEQRLLNLKGAFVCDPQLAARCKGAHVLLIDDVITTCATVSECGRVLHGAGLTEVCAAALARG